MIFIDASAYLSVLLPGDPNRKRAIEILASIDPEENQIITSYAIVGEILTVGSQRYDRKETIRFVEDILAGSNKIIPENQAITERAFEIFKKITDKDVGWVDCYSFAIIEHFKIEKVFSFDKDFVKHSKAEILR